MPLIPGTRFGSYEIVAAIGAGGMGEVYRARDTKLHREVALKILPDAFATDSERLARFEREATTLASLNHPNIAHIYGVEGPALVMELVEGDDLSARIAMGAIATGDALLIARQIAEALEAAHDRGIVHRDLKPANVKVRDDGVVKVLDFGLAKALAPAEGASASADAANSPTLTAAGTQLGVVLGTAAYMSPEQAKGKGVDRRADIWAFGVVLFEMLTGRSAFAGETVTDIIAAVVTRDPEWTALPASTPASIVQLLKRCLTRDVRQRLQSIAEARIAIESVISAAPDQSMGTMSTTAARSAPRWRERLAWSLAAGAIVLAGVLIVRRGPPATTPPATMEFLVQVPFAVSDFSTSAPEPSPDGRSLLYPAKDAQGVRQLWIRPLDSLEARLVGGTSGLSEMSSFGWSPDGLDIVFVADGKLKRVSLAGGAPVVIAESARARGVAWSRSGVVLFPTTFLSGLFAAPAAGGGPVVPVTKPKVGSHRWPSMLPDDRHFLFTASPSSGHQGVYSAALDGSDERLLLPLYTSARYANGRLLFVRDAQLMAQPFDADRQTLAGEARTVVAPVLAVEGIGHAQFAVRDNMLVYRTGTVDATFAWIDRGGSRHAVADGLHRSREPMLSPDGRHVAFVQNTTQPEDVWTLNLENGGLVRLTRGPEFDNEPHYSQDGQRIAYRSDQWVKVTSAGGGGSIGDLIKGPIDGLDGLSDWSRDGSRVLLEVMHADTQRDIYIADVAGSRPPEPLVATAANEATARFSPNGAWVAFVSDTSGTDEVFAQPAVVGATPQQISSGGATNPTWRADGRELFYMSPSGYLMAVPIDIVAGKLQSGRPERLFEVPGAIDYTPAPDGRRFLFSLWARAPETRIVLNWMGLLTKR